MVHLHIRASGPLITSIVDAGSAGPGFSNGSWVKIRGFGLAATSRTWQPQDFNGDNLPTVLDGVRVTVFDRPGYISSVSPTFSCRCRRKTSRLGPLVYRRLTAVAGAIAGSPPRSLTESAASSRARASSPSR